MQSRTIRQTLRPLNSRTTWLKLIHREEPPTAPRPHGAQSLQLEMNPARGTGELFNVSSQLQGTFSGAKIRTELMVLRRY